MSWERVWSILQFAVMAGAGVLLWSLRQAFRAGSYSTNLDYEVQHLKRRMNQAGDKMSEFATYIQGATERYRQIFATLDQHRELRAEVKELRDKMDKRVADDNSPWPNNRRRRGGDSK
jgi:hypothetical protein